MDSRPQSRAGRLEALASMVPVGSRVADVGTDRAALPLALLASGRASHCVATERDAVRLERARRLPPGHPLGPRLELRAGDGLEPLVPGDRLDVVVIAGLGAHAICRILGAPGRAALGARRFLLDPRTDSGYLRRWLARGDLAIVEERLVLERSRWFALIAAEPGTTAPGEPPPPLTDEDVLEAGPRLLRDRGPLLARYWREELARQDRILGAAGPGRGRGREAARRRRDLAARILEAIGLECSAHGCGVRTRALPPSSVESGGPR